MVEEEIANGRFNIYYRVFAGYQAPNEGVMRPLPKEEAWSRRLHYSITDQPAVLVQIPKGLREIGEGAFENCEELAAVSIPDSISIIGSKAFAGCISLRRVEIPDGVNEVKEDTFYGCSALTQVTLPRSISKIRERAFFSCTSLSEIEIPDQVEEIGNSAFCDCTSLTRVHVPDSVRRMDHFVFSGCTGLQELYLPKAVVPDAKDILGEINLFAWRWFTGKLKVNPALEEVFQANVKRRRKAIVKDAVAADDVEILNRSLALWDKVPLELLGELIETAVNAQKVGSTAALMQYKNSRYAQNRVEAAAQIRTEKRMGIRNRSIADWRRVFTFRDDEKEIVIQSHKGWEAVIQVPAVIGKKPVAAIERWLPRNCEEENVPPYTVLLPEGIREIKESAFEYSCLESIHIPATVTKIGSYAFQYCSNLKEICLPPGLTHIEGFTFLRCTALQSVSIPESVRYIDMDAFCGCSSLRQLALPANVQSIHVYYLISNIRLTVPRGSITEETIRKTPLHYEAV